MKKTVLSSLALLALLSNPLLVVAADSPAPAPAGTGAATDGSIGASALGPTIIIAGFTVLISVALENGWIGDDNGNYTITPSAPTDPCQVDPDSCVSPPPTTTTTTTATTTTTTN